MMMFKAVPSKFRQVCFKNADQNISIIINALKCCAARHSSYLSEDRAQHRPHMYSTHRFTLKYKEGFVEKKLNPIGSDVFSGLTGKFGSRLKDCDAGRSV